MLSQGLPALPHFCPSVRTCTGDYTDNLHQKQGSTCLIKTAASSGEQSLLLSGQTAFAAAQTSSQVVPNLTGDYRSCWFALLCFLPLSSSYLCVTPQNAQQFMNDWWPRSALQSKTPNWIMLLVFKRAKKTPTNTLIPLNHFHVRNFILSSPERLRCWWKAGIFKYLHVSNWLCASGFPLSRVLRWKFLFVRNT